MNSRQEFRLDRGLPGQQVVRIDLRLSPLETPRILADGSMIAYGRAARTGDHEYPWGIERRDEAELSSIVSQLNYAPILVGHPDKLLRYGGTMPNAGQVLRASMREDHAYVEMRLNGTGINALKSGRDELSLGYETTVVNGRQTLTRVDHLAMIHAARCGASCEIRVDCGGDLGCGCKIEKTPASLQMQVINQLGAIRLK